MHSDNPINAGAMIYRIADHVPYAAGVFLVAALLFGVVFF